MAKLQAEPGVIHRHADTYHTESTGLHQAESGLHPAFDGGAAGADNIALGMAIAAAIGTIHDLTRDGADTATRQAANIHQLINTIQAAEDRNTAVFSRLAGEVTR